MNNTYSKQVLKNSLAIYLGRGFNLFISFFVFIRLANYLGETAFGRFSSALAYIAIFDIIANFGLNYILVREISSEKLKSEELFAGIVLKAIFVLIAALLSFSVAFFLPYSRETLIVIWIITIDLFISSKLSSFRSVFETPFQAKLIMKYPILFSVMDHLIFAALVFIFTTRYRTGLTGIAVFYTVCHIPGTLSMLFLFFKKFKIKFIAGYSRMKGLFFETLPVGLYVLLSTLTSRLDILFLSWMKGDAEVGYYSAAYRLVYPLMFFVQAFSASLFPMLSRFYEERKDQYVRILRMGVNCILLFAVFLGIAVAFNSRQIITRVYISSYQPAIGILQILIIAVAFHFLNFYFVDIFVSARRQKIITYVMAAILFLDVILNLVLITRYGFLGAAYTRLAIAIICFFVYYYLFSRILKIKGLILYRKWIVFLILSVIWNLIFNRFHFILNTLLYAGFCAGLVFLLKIFSVDEMNVLKNLFRREAEESPPSIDV